MKRLAVMFLCLMKLCRCIAQRQVQAEASNKAGNLANDFISESAITELLVMDLWNSIDIHDSSHVLMIPMH